MRVYKIECTVIDTEDSLPEEALRPYFENMKFVYPRINNLTEYEISDEEFDDYNEGRKSFYDLPSVAKAFSDWSIKK